MLDPLQRLRNAVILGNLPITKRLLLRFPELWLNIDANNDGWNNLHYACYHGHYLICFHLISWIKKTDSHYSQLDLLTFDGLLVLHLSTINHHHQILHYLLQDFGKPWINLAGGKCHQTPLHYCCLNDFKQGVELLLAFGADYNVVDNQGNTCFHLCFQYDSLNCLQMLLKFILTTIKDRDTAINEIDQLESYKNKKGWVPYDYASTFDLIAKYKQLKKSLLAANLDSEFSESYTVNLSPETSSVRSGESSILNVAFNKSSTSLENNKILASTIVSVAKKGRVHSLSLPGSAPETTLRPKTERQRSNTTALTKPPAIAAASAAFASSMNGTTNTATVQTPTTRTPSLKSVTISPSHRHFNNPPSPQSTISTASSIESSDRTRSRKSFSNGSSSNANQWSFLHSQAVNLVPVQESQTSNSSHDSASSPRPRGLSNAASYSKLNLSRGSLDKKREDNSPSLRKSRSSAALLTNTNGFTKSKSSDNLKKNISSISFTRVDRN